jgi:hypothetical protein
MSRIITTVCVTVMAALPAAVVTTAAVAQTHV